MSLAGFTNETGYHQRSALAQGYQYGTYYGQPVGEIIYDEPYVAEYASKPLATGSDHHRPTDWFRSVGTIVTNKPSTKHRLVHNGDGEDRHVVVDLRVDDHITNHYKTFSYEVIINGSDEAHNAALTKAKNKLKPDNTGWGENLGQGKKTCEDLAKRVGTFAELLLAMKRGNVREAAKRMGKLGPGQASKDVASLWLEYQYVVKPTMNDIYGLNKAAIDALKMVHPFNVVSTAHADSDYQFVFDTLDVHAAGKSSFRAQLNGSMANTASYLLDSAGLVNPIDIAWELLPWSFVVDWFIPVGNTLQAMTAGYGLNDNGGWITNHVDTTLRIQQVLDIEDGTDGYRMVNPGAFEERRFAFSRYCFIAWPEWTGFYTALNPYSSAHGLNALALLRQLV